ncbi:MAG: gamma-glutamyl-gamma-aminobutyrate hydrolase family protein [Victivallales bacterium]|nr:gamma-glutamyl-gamma-aminobutyrate hydrolase family protein [Victivallales bacterium]
MKKPSFIAILLCIVLAVAGCCSQGKTKIGIAWRADSNSKGYISVCRAIEAAGGKPVLLDQVVSNEVPYTEGKVSQEAVDENGILLQKYADKIKAKGFRKSNAASVAKGIKAIVFTGGEDISPTLFARPVPWHGLEEDKRYNVTRDISDYLLMAHCLEQDIAVLGLCRGCQVLGVVAGTDMIQDIPAHYTKLKNKPDYTHRLKKVPNVKRDYNPHPVKVTQQNSHFAKIVGGDILPGCPSWHHQAVTNLKGTGLIVTGTTEVNGIEIIEAFENPKKRFVLGVQFHPEIAVTKNLDNAPNKGDYMSYEQALAFFKAIVDAAH